MAIRTGIAWCEATFNPWVGCTKVSPACDFCYAETWAKRSGHPELWHGERRRTRPANWTGMRLLNLRAMDDGSRPRVFCASLADVFDNQAPPEWRADLWTLIDECRNLDWLLLTKRIQNAADMLPPGPPWPHVAIGVTAENQAEYDRRAPILCATPAAARFLSCEPLLGPILLNPAWRVDQVIVGGESGGNARPMLMTSAFDLLMQCQAYGIAAFFKQVGSGRRGCWPSSITGKGDNPDQWPERFRIQQPLPTLSATRT